MTRGPTRSASPRGGKSRAILLATQVGPPTGFSNGPRVAGFAKYLSRAGHRVTVLTSLAFGSGPVPEAAATIRTRDLVATWVNPRRARFEALRDGASPPAEEADAGDYEGGHSLLARWLVPDLSLVGWVPFALPRALDLARRTRIDCVITSSPPESGHLIGMALKRRGIPWIAELRDGWMFETTHPSWPVETLGRIDGALERSVAREADLVVCATDPLTDDIRERLGAEAVTLANGFEPDDVARASPADGLLSSDRHSLVHTGRMAFSDRSPKPLLEAVNRIERRDPGLAGRLELAFAGPLSTAERTAIDGPFQHARVRALGTLDYPVSLGLQRAADSLVVITGRERRSEATSKLFEYLAAETPILVLGERTAAAEIVADADAGIVTSATDPAAIAEGIEQMVENATGKPGPEVVERYSFPRLARELEDHVEHVIAGSREVRTGAT